MVQSLQKWFSMSFVLLPCTWLFSLGNFLTSHSFIRQKKKKIIQRKENKKTQSQANQPKKTKLLYNKYENIILNLTESRWPWHGKNKKDIIIKYAKFGEPLLNILNSYFYYLTSKKGKKFGVGWGGVGMSDGTYFASLS